MKQLGQNMIRGSWGRALPALLLTGWGPFILLLTVSANASLVLNGDFSTGDLTSWDYTGSPAVGGMVPSDAFTFSAQLNSSQSISQTIATTIGDSYAFSFYFSSGPLNPACQFTASFGQQAVFASHDATVPWEFMSFTVLAADSSETIQFTAQSSPDFYYYVTGIEVNDLGVVVPEPSTILFGVLLLLPFGAGAVRFFRAERVV